MEDAFSTYYGLLRRVHRHLRPRRYLEIGVHKGHSLAFVEAGTTVVGVDPEPMLERPPPPDTTIVAATSDDFFTDPQYRRLRQDPFDLVFVDGLHLFEQALADILRAEQVCHRDSVILVHDCLPPDAVTAARERTTVLWSGDVWKAVLALRSHRPDLRLAVIDAEPTGMGLITGIEPASAGLPAWYDQAVEALSPMTFDQLAAAGRDETLGVVPGRWSSVEPHLP